MFDLFCSQCFLIQAGVTFDGPKHEYVGKNVAGEMKEVLSSRGARVRDDDDDAADNIGSAKNNNSDPGDTAKIAPPKPGRCNRRARVLYDYAGETDEELSIAVDATVRIKEVDESGWWYAEDESGKSGF